LLAEVDKCIEVLVKSKRMAEATIFAKAYAPSRLTEMIGLWSLNLKENNYPFQPDDISKTQAAQIQVEIAKEH
jgi:coatomer subunit beta'